MLPTRPTDGTNFHGVEQTVGRRARASGSSPCNRSTATANSSQQHERLRPDRAAFACSSAAAASGIVFCAAAVEGDAPDLTGRLGHGRLAEGRIAPFPSSESCTRLIRLCPARELRSRPAGPSLPACDGAAPAAGRRSTERSGHRQPRHVHSASRLAEKRKRASSTRKPKARPAKRRSPAAIVQQREEPPFLPSGVQTANHIFGGRRHRVNGESFSFPRSGVGTQLLDAPASSAYGDRCGVGHASTTPDVANCVPTPDRGSCLIGRMKLAFILIIHTSSMRYREHDHIRANLQGRFVLQAVAVRMRELLPAVAQVEAAVNHRQPAVEA